MWVCVTDAPDAIELSPVSARWFHVPSSMTEWEERRLEFHSASNARANGPDW
jgi:hypothetical protein